MQNAWELGHEELEQLRALRHGRDQIRRAPRAPSSAAVRLMRPDGDSIEGLALDRSSGGARLIALSLTDLERGELVDVAFDDGEVRRARVVWARFDRQAAVLGVEFLLVAAA